MQQRTRKTDVATILAAAAISSLMLSGCASEPESAAPASDAVLASHDLDGLSARQVIQQLDATPLTERSTDLMASIRPDTLLLTDASGEETSIEMPADEFYVSIAPYVDQTHECFFHSLTTCKGELGNEEINVQVIDDSGKTLVDESVQTYDNGFVGLWLPRDINGTITIEHQGRSVTDSISTGQDDPTCITTLQLT